MNERMPEPYRLQNSTDLAEERLLLVKFANGELPVDELNLALDRLFGQGKLGPIDTRGIVREHGDRI